MLCKPLLRYSVLGRYQNHDYIWVLPEDLGLFQLVRTLTARYLTLVRDAVPTGRIQPRVALASG
jgi:hypothetical protein